MPPLTVEELQRLEQRVKECQSAYDRAQGAVSTIRSQIKSEFGVTTIDEARNKLDQLENETRLATEALEKKRNAFHKKFGHRL